MTAPLNGKKVFGTGRFFANDNVASPTPARFLVPQDMAITFKRGVKSLFGENQLPVDVSGGELDVTGKVTYATTNARVLSSLMLGASQSPGTIFESDNESGTIGSNIITVANHTTWTSDLGVVNATTGARYQCVASSPQAGVSYTVAAGVYTFNASETGTVFYVSYLYTISGSGVVVTMANQPQGKVADFTGIYVLPWVNSNNVLEQDVITLNSCIASDTEIATKSGDYAKPTFGFSAACDAFGNLGTFAFAEAA